MVLPMWSVINDLTGRTETLHIPGEIQNSESALKVAAKEGAIILLGHNDADLAMFYFLVGEYQKFLEMTRKAYEHRNGFDFNVTFYECLATFALAWTLNIQKNKNHIYRCRNLAKRMRKWADRCPENFLNKQLLMDAEIAAAKGNSSLALTLYEESASKANIELFSHEEGIAYERLGLYQLHLGNIAGAKMSFEYARVAFQKWGASIVVSRIEILMASINGV
jgi:histidine kinase